MVVAGEVSGDIYGSLLIAEIKRQSPSAEIFGCGGKRMESAGMELLYNTVDDTVMGITEILGKLSEYKRILNGLSKTIDERNPDKIVLIDFPGFNIRLGKTAKQKGKQVVYYISPKVWAWAKNRIRQIAEISSKILLIFPFENEIYRQYTAKVKFVGHPILDVIENSGVQGDAFKDLGIKPETRVISFFAGSRKQEINRIFPVLLDTIEIMEKELEGYCYIFGFPDESFRDVVEKMLAGRKTPAKFIFGNVYGLMRQSCFAVAKSGTVTLELALFGVPMLIIYRTSALTYLMGRILIKIGFLGLPNIIAGRKIVKELIQNEAAPRRIAGEVISALKDDNAISKMKKDLEEVRKAVGKPGATKRVATEVLN